MATEANKPEASAAIRSAAGTLALAVYYLRAKEVAMAAPLARQIAADASRDVQF